MNIEKEIEKYKKCAIENRENGINANPSKANRAAKWILNFHKNLLKQSEENQKIIVNTLLDDGIQPVVLWIAGFAVSNNVCKNKAISKLQGILKSPQSPFDKFAAKIHLEKAGLL